MPFRTQAVQIPPEHGVSFYQLDLTFYMATQMNSRYGLIVLDFEALTAFSGIPKGYVNVMTGQGWVVRNVPVNPSIGHPGLSTMFELGGPGDIESIDAYVDFSADPVISFSGMPDASFVVGDLSNNAEGIDGLLMYVPQHPIDAVLIEYDPLGLFYEVCQPGHPNIEQENGQCAPAALANSLQWLEDEFGLYVPDKNIPGNCDDKGIVGKLDNLMGRKINNTPDECNDILRGLLKYLNNNHLGPLVSVKHKVRPGSEDNCSDECGGLSDEDMTEGEAKSVADTSDLSMFDWILNELEAGEDVEVKISWAKGSGHMIGITGAGLFFGVPYIIFQHDAKQCDPNQGTSWFDGGLGFSTVIDNQVVCYFNGEEHLATIDYAISESFDPPVWWDYIITNNTGNKAPGLLSAASDLHLTFTGAGGNLFAEVISSTEGCPRPTIPSNYTVTNTVVIDWGSDCIPPGESVTIRVITKNGPIKFSSGFWSSTTQPNFPGIGPVRDEDIVEIPSSPIPLSHLGIIIFCALVVGTVVLQIIKKTH